jgi:hypothetical protein
MEVKKTRGKLVFETAAANKKNNTNFAITPSPTFDSNIS